MKTTIYLSIFALVLITALLLSGNSITGGSGASVALAVATPTISPVNADLLDNQHGSYYRSATNLNAGTLNPARYSAWADLAAEGYLGNASGDLARNNGVLQATLNADYLDGKHANAFWKLGGNPLGSTGIFGITTNNPLEFVVNNTLALRLEPNATSPNIIGGYSGNAVTAGVYGATIGGGGAAGNLNRVTDAYGTVGGGAYNRAGDNAGTVDDNQFATVGGGGHNTASDAGATVGGGYLNTASYGDATVGGGEGNIASGLAATIVGGFDNTASGDYSTVGGGDDNHAAGDMSFVAGWRAYNTNAAHKGVFLFSDLNDFPFRSTAANEFAARATGGVRFVLAIDGTTGAPTWTCSVVNGGSWACSSDRNLKENLKSVNGQDVLTQVAAMPLYTWNGKGTDPSVRHMGPTAQDFYAAFGLGNDDKSIATIDLDGVALASIQALAQKDKQLESRIAALESGKVPAADQHSGLAVPLPWLLFGGLAVLNLGYLAGRRWPRRG